MNSKQIDKTKYLSKPSSEGLFAMSENDMMSLEDARARYLMEERKIILNGYTFPSKPSSDGYYHINVKDNTKKGGRKQLKARTLEELADKVYKHEKGISGRTRKTFREVFELVEERKLSLVKDEIKKEKAKRTSDRHRCDYRRYFDGTAFERMFVDEITEHDIEAVVEMNLTRYDLKKKALDNNMKSLLKSVFDLAFKQRWTDENVFLRVDFEQFKNMTEKSAPIRERMHSDEDIRRMKKYIAEKHRKDPGYLPAYALELQMEIGLRRGEVPTLSEKDIRTREIGDIKITSIKVNKELLRSNHIDPTTKTGKDREVILTQTALNIIEAVRFQKARKGWKTDNLFPAEKTATNQSGVISYDAVADFYNRMCRKLGIDTDKDLMKGTHAFRRTVETNLRNNGINAQATGEYLGHDARVGDKHYYGGGYAEEEMKKIANM